LKKKKRLSKLDEIADKNTKNLKIENERVNKNLRNCCNCWIYLMVVIVFVVFLMMILFMKLFPKRRYPAEVFTTTKSYQDALNFNSSINSLNVPFKNDL
jgi:heme/copper-type cytochrome/quinol oxidase subunit 2